MRGLTDAFLGGLPRAPLDSEWRWFFYSRIGRAHGSIIALVARGASNSREVMTYIPLFIVVLTPEGSKGLVGDLGNGLHVGYRQSRELGNWGTL